MPLLSSMMRYDAFTGRTDAVNAWFGKRQSGRWAPPARPPASRPPVDAAETLRELTDLHGRGVVTDAEFERLRGRLRV